MTSKIKEITSVKPHQNSYGTTYYHQLIMDNGDKIEIGKKSECKVGWELTYEIIGDDQYEYRKAKASKPEDRPAQSFDNRQSSIVAQFCFREANLIIINKGLAGSHNSDIVDEVGQLAVEIGLKIKDIENALK
jgi:hypothetical protein